MCYYSAGRQRTTSCKYVGSTGECWTDVKRKVNGLCGGKRNCTIGVPNLDLQKWSGCKNGLTYLKAQYRCVGVRVASKQACDSHSYIILKSESAYVSSSIAQSIGIGTENCPWRIQRPPGQTIALTAIIFNVTEGCHRLFDVHDLETGAEKTVTACNTSYRYYEQIGNFSNRVEIKMNAKFNNPREQHEFVVYYEG